MQIEELIEAILKEAKQKAEKIKEQTQQEYQQILKDAHLQASRQAEALIKEKTEEFQQEKKGIVTQAILEKKRIVLAAKREIIEDIFRILLERIDTENLPLVKKVFRDKVIGERLSKDEFIKNIKDKFEKELVKLIGLDEKDI